jgi:hypothetical protein
MVPSDNNSLTERPVAPKNCVRTHAHAYRAGVRPDRKTTTCLRETGLLSDDDRLAVLELDFVDVPGTAGSAAAQGVDRELDLVTGL